MKQALQWLTIFLLLAAILGCSTTPPTVSTDKGIVYTEKGQASFYADKHENKKTACGERYNHDLNTAAHRTIPCGAKVKITNVENGKTVVAVVNDRGPFVNGRIVDLSKSAFSSIANPSSGVITVQIEVVE